jgi:hypothetical protein
MIRALTILVAVAALAVSAAPAPAASGSPAGFSLSLDGINCGFYAEMDSGLTPSAVVLKHGQGTAAFLSWAQSGTHKNATLELHAADGTTSPGTTWRTPGWRRSRSAASEPDRRTSCRRQ